MNIAIIIAGGSGHRMGQDIPKQFINVYDKPVLIYTLEGFQKHPQIDAIEVVCIDGWHDIVWAYAKQCGITKLKRIISGGETPAPNTPVSIIMTKTMMYALQRTSFLGLLKITRRFGWYSSK